MTVKKWSTSEEKEVNIMKKPVSSLPTEIPDVYVAPHVPLSAARQYYLYDNLRRFCSSEEKKNELAPEPDIDRPAMEDAREFYVQRSDPEIADEEDRRGFRIHVEGARAEREERNNNQYDSDSEDFINPETESESEEITEGITQSEIDEPGTVESMDVDEPDRQMPDVMTLPTPSKRSGCGSCNRCRLYLEYKSGARTKNYKAIPLNQRFRCGKCGRCRRKKLCVNVTCQYVE